MSIPGLPPLLLRAGLRYQRHHRWQAALALIGIVMGVAVVLAVDIANQSAKASFTLSAEQLQGAATHRLVGAAGPLPEAVYRALFTTPGHPPMAPVIELAVRVDGIAGRFRLVGLDIFAEGPFRDTLPDTVQGQVSLAEWLSQPGLAALNRAALARLDRSVGARLQVNVRGQPHTLTLYAVADDSSEAGRDLLVVDIATAQALSGMAGQLSHIDLILDADAEAWLGPRLPDGVRLVAVDEQTAGVVSLSSAFELNLTAMSLLALLVGMFLIFNAISFSVVQRRNLVGRLRALGVRRDEIARLVFAEALVLGLVGTLLGGLLGVWLGQGLTAIVSATVSELYYEVAAAAAGVQPLSLVKAALLGIAGTLAAAWVPAHQAAATPPVTSLSRAALEQATHRLLPGLALAGGILCVSGLGIAFAAPGGVLAGFAGLFVLLLGSALLTPPLLHLLHRLLRMLRVQGVWRMAVRDLDRHLSRLGTAAAALMIALSASVGVAVMVDSMRDAVSDWLASLLNADLYLAAESFEEGATLPAAVVAQAPTLAPVSGHSTYRNLTLTLPGDRRPIDLVAARLDPRSRRGFDFIERGAGDPWQGFDRGAILVSEPLARRLQLGAGDHLAIPTPQGPIDFDVAGVFRDFASEHGRIFMPRAAYARYWEDHSVNTIALFTDATPGALTDTVTQAFADRYALRYTPAQAIYAESMAVFERTFRITEVLRLLSVLVALIGVFSALMAVQLERRKEYAVLRALGLTRWQVGGLIMIGSGLLGLLAALLAIPTGIGMAWVLIDAVQLRAFGWTLPFALSGWPLLLTVAVGVCAALAASLYPAWRSAWYPPAAQLRED